MWLVVSLKAEGRKKNGGRKEQIVVYSARMLFDIAANRFLLFHFMFPTCIRLPSLHDDIRTETNEIYGTDETK